MSNKHGGWRVVSATFERSAPKLGSCPDPDVPEIAVAGRSNVGKSSLLNAFAQQRGLARVSRTPGRTQLLNFFQMSLRHPQHGDRPLRWVDLPGYGYAAAPRSVREGFGPMIETYLTKRRVLRALILLVDSRRKISDADLQLVEAMSARQLPTLVVATKADKLSKSERGLVTRGLADVLGASPRDILLTSASTGIGLGDEPRSGGLAYEVASLTEPEPVAPEPILEQALEPTLGQPAEA
ncbi:MAG: ribosome biogenesis GTP-binding protein YihA/YsxC [Nannocystaceae bacterium]